MHRFLVDKSVLEAVHPVLDGEAAGHLRVLRPKAGELFELFDGAGAFRLYKYDRESLSLTASSELQFAPRSPFEITLYAAITKGERWDWTIQKASELGAARIVALQTERTIVRIAPNEREGKLRRWRKIAKEAAQQSDAKWLTEIAGPVGVEEALMLAGDAYLVTGALCEGVSKTLLGALGAMEKGARSVGVFIGPEGDWSPAELSMLLEKTSPVTFGRQVLRAETAAIYAMSVIGAALLEKNVDLQ